MFYYLLFFLLIKKQRIISGALALAMMSSVYTTRVLAEELTVTSMAYCVLSNSFCAVEISLLVELAICGFKKFVR